MLQELQRLFAYDTWANLETAGALIACNTPPDRARKILAHLVGADRLWQERLRPEGARPVVWPDLTPAQCREGLLELGRAWDAYLGAVSPRGLQHPILYRNSRGEEWSSTVKDILLHVISHSAHHRGQVASELRNAGFEPACTDYIHCVRQGWIEEGP